MNIYIVYEYVRQMWSVFVIEIPMIWHNYACVLWYFLPCSTWPPKKGKQTSYTCTIEQSNVTTFCEGRATHGYSKLYPLHSDVEAGQLNYAIHLSLYYVRIGK